MCLPSHTEKYKCVKEQLKLMTTLKTSSAIRQVAHKKYNSIELLVTVSVSHMHKHTLCCQIQT